ncbi:hypothetical protein SAMN04488505_105191 [Chitinophaga rupis]|uniref:Uncharacterized protein n=1 Tax=Chitinophaga rupis TaxID=573321 RepID=A0A1H7ZVC2_9BACT|nr:hypothetical protein [Chitinophaga rupis]SEM61449.1 hypothetical protein SAMN04488505_105191 [Chitinophaga rupis]
MKQEEIQKLTDFLGVKVLTPMEENLVVGGAAEVDPVDVGHHHDHDSVEAA